MDDWTQDHTDELGDVACSKLEAENDMLRKQVAYLKTYRDNLLAEREATRDNSEPVTIAMTRGEWYVKRLREWLKGVWIWKNVP